VQYSTLVFKSECHSHYISNTVKTPLYQIMEGKSLIRQRGRDTGNSIKDIKLYARFAEQS